MRRRRRRLSPTRDRAVRRRSPATRRRTGRRRRPRSGCRRPPRGPAPRHPRRARAPTGVRGAVGTRLRDAHLTPNAEPSPASASTCSARWPVTRTTDLDTRVGELRAGAGQHRPAVDRQHRLRPSGRSPVAAGAPRPPPSRRRDRPAGGRATGRRAGRAGVSTTEQPPLDGGAGGAARGAPCGRWRADCSAARTGDPGRPHERSASTPRFAIERLAELGRASRSWRRRPLVAEEVGELVAARRGRRGADPASGSGRGAGRPSRARSQRDERHHEREEPEQAAAAAADPSDRAWGRSPGTSRPLPVSLAPGVAAGAPTKMSARNRPAPCAAARDRRRRPGLRGGRE